jgi:hypothetical protein
LVEANGRAVLFWTFVGVEVLLLLRFIVFPIFKLLKLQEIDYNEASIIIGSHFVDVNDSLTNFPNCQIRARSNIPPITASIDQKTNALEPIPLAMP